MMPFLGEDYALKIQCVALSILICIAQPYAAARAGTEVVAMPNGAVEVLARVLLLLSEQL